MKKEIKQITRFDSHFYEVIDNDISYLLPSVTTKQSVEHKPGLVKWYQQVGMNSVKILDEAAERGSRVHDAIEKAMKGYTIVCNNLKAPMYTKDELKELGEKIHIMHYDDELEMVYKALDWLNSLEISGYAVEETVYDLQNNYAGRNDLRARIENGFIAVNRKKIELNGHYIIDWKTGSEFEQHKEQGVAYGKAIEKMFDTEIDGVILVYLSAKNKAGIKFQLIERDDFDHYFEKFLCVSKLYDMRNGTKIREKLEIPSVLQFDNVLID